MNTHNDLGQLLASWFEADAAASPPPQRLARVLDSTRGLRPRPTPIARIGGAWVDAAPRSSVADGGPVRTLILIALVAVLAVVLVGGALFMGGQPATTSTDRSATATTLDAAGLSAGLIMVAPDEHAGEIRVVRPDGQVHGLLDVDPTPPAGCTRVLVAGGDRVAAVLVGGAIRIEPLDGRDPVSIAIEGRESLGMPALSPDGSRVAYLTRPRGDRSDLTILSLVDGRETVVARDLRDASLAWDSWSVDDTLAIAYNGATESGIDLIQADGSEHRVLIRQPLSGPSNKTGMLVAWSSDGTHLAFAPIHGIGPRLGDEVRAATYVVDVATGWSKVVARADGTPVDAWRPIQNRVQFLWSPDGRTVAYPTETGLTLLDLTTGRVNTMADPHQIRPVWSPDGSRIAFLTSDGSAFQPGTGALLSSVPPGATDSGRLTTVRADLTGRVDQDVAFGARHLAWSPDSQQIAVLAGSSIDLHDPDAKRPPQRISNEVAWSPSACFTWSNVATAP